MTNKKAMSKMTKKRVLNATLAMALAAGMLFGSVHLPNFGGHNVTIGTQDVMAAEPDATLRNLQALLDSAKNLKVGNEVEDIFSQGMDCMGKIGGVYNNATMILKLTGVMKDPTATKLADIQKTLSDMNITIQDMNATLSSVAQELQQMDVFMREANRVEQVNNAIKCYKDFGQYCEKDLIRIMTEYEDAMIDGFENWYKNADRSGISIYFAYDDDGNLKQVYNYEDTDYPTESVEGKTIVQTKTIRLSAEAVNHMMEGAPKYNVNNYRNTIIDRLVKEIIAQADAGTLTAPRDFYQSWNNMTADEKAAEAAVIAEQAYGALSSRISSEEMQNSTLASRAYDAYLNYSKGITDVGSVLDAELDILFLTHGFEGEVKQQVKDILDSMNVQSGVYATMTLTLMKQNGRESEKRLNDVVNSWTAATNKIEEKQKSALTNHDNYCYITKSLVNYEERTMNYSNSITMRRDNSTVAYKGTECHTESLLNDNDRIADTTRMSMLYGMAKGTDKGQSFEKYLKNNSIGMPENARNIVSETGEWKDFSVKSGIYMNQGHRAEDSGHDYWGDTFTTKVNSGNSGSIKDDNFENCKIITGTVVNLETDGIESGATLGAMAAYGESHWYWFSDEGYLMGNADDCKVEHHTDSHTDYSRQGSRLTCITKTTCNYTATYGVLVLSDVKDEDPLEAVGLDDLVEDISAIAPAQHVENDYEVINVDTDKSALIDGDEKEQAQDEPQVEPQPQDESQVEPQEEAQADIQPDSKPEEQSAPEATVQPEEVVAAE